MMTSLYSIIMEVLPMAYDYFDEDNFHMRNNPDYIDYGEYPELEDEMEDYGYHFDEIGSLADDDYDYFEEQYDENGDPLPLDVIENNLIGQPSLFDYDDTPWFDPASKCAGYTPTFTPYVKPKFTWKYFFHRVREFFEFYRGAGTLFYKKQNGKLYVLLIKRPSGIWSVPGGGKEFHDKSYQDAALRESKEELSNCKFDFNKSKNVKDIKRLASFKFYPWFRYDVFTARLTGEVKTQKWDIQKSEIRKARWFNVDKLPKYRYFNIKYLCNKLKKVC